MTGVNVRQSGFTLLEILIAMAIFSLIGLASTGVLSTVIDSSELSETRFERLQTLQRAMMTLERDILQAADRAVRIDGESNEVVIIGGEDVLDSETDGIAFVRGGWQNPQLMLRRSTMQAVGYRLQEQTLQRVYSNYVDNVTGYEPKVRVLLDNIEDFRVEFYVDKSKDPEDTNAWVSTLQATELPAGIAVIITSTDFGEVRREFALAAGLGESS